MWYCTKPGLLATVLYCTKSSVERERLQLTIKQGSGRASGVATGYKATQQPGNGQPRLPEHLQYIIAEQNTLLVPYFQRPYSWMNCFQCCVQTWWLLPVCVDC